jgi:hypothetical protein
VPTLLSGYGAQLLIFGSPGTLPQSCNAPQKIKYDLYSEQLNGTSFISSRQTVQHAWFYRIYPSVAHGAMRTLPVNPDVSVGFSPFLIVRAESVQVCAIKTRRTEKLPAYLSNHLKRLSVRSQRRMTRWNSWRKPSVGSRSQYLHLWGQRSTLLKGLKPSLVKATRPLRKELPCTYTPLMLR